MKKAIGKEITRIGTEVTKPVIDNVKESAHVCIQSGGHLVKNFAIENCLSENLQSQNYNKNCFLKSVYTILDYQTLFWVPFLLITLYTGTDNNAASMPKKMHLQVPRIFYQHNTINSNNFRPSFSNFIYVITFVFFLEKKLLNLLCY